MRTTAKDGGATTSVWTGASVPSYDTPPEPETDVCIIGAGIAGLTTAFELARRGTRVMVIDDGPIGGGETGRTTAHLASAVDDRFSHLESKFGESGAKLMAESHASAIDYIETLVHELRIDCDFQRVDGYLFAAPGAASDKTERELDRELAAARRAGLVADKVARAPLPFDTGPAIRFGRQAEFHPLRYLRGLAEAFVQLGGKIHTHVRAERIEPGQPLAIKLADDRRILCRVAVDATNGAMTSPIKMSLRQAAYRSYVLAFDLEPGLVPHALYWDTSDPYHYIRVARGEAGREMLLVGGADHRVGQGEPARAWLDLESWTRRWIPFAGDLVARWSGQIIEPADGPAHIGRSPDLEHVYLCTGDSGNGLTHGTIAGMIIPSLMRGHEPTWSAIYDPDRSHLRALGTLVKEAASSASPYTDWLRGGDVGSTDDIRPGHGALVRRGLHMIAAFRDEAGTCHLRSATCPHLRGVVHWNEAEKTWDCPCHGSRFDAYGRVVNGPASTGLAHVDTPSDARPPARPPAERDDRHGYVGIHVPEDPA
ncbi:MAG: FAD-dependent oxidoreductase [Kofleriaceae bacterium]